MLVVDLAHAEGLVIKPTAKKKPENESDNKPKKNPFLVLALVILGAAAWVAYDQGYIGSANKKAETATVEQPQEPTPAPVKEPEPAGKMVTFMLLPRYLHTDTPTILNINRGTDLQDLIAKIEKEVSSKTLTVKVMVDSEYAYSRSDFSDMNNSFVAASLSPLLRIKLRKAPIEPVATFSPHSSYACFREAVVIVKENAGINTIADLKDKKMLVEGIAEGPSILFNKFTDEVNTEAKGIYSNIAFQMEKAGLIDGLRGGTADALFLNMYTVPAEGYYTILGRLGEQNKIQGFEDFKVLHLTHYNLPCGLLMATADISQEVRDEFLKNLTEFLAKKENRELLDQKIGIKSFTPTPAETWTKSVEFMNNFTVESPPGKVVMEKIKNSTK